MGARGRAWRGCGQPWDSLRERPGVIHRGAAVHSHPALSPGCYTHPGNAVRPVPVSRLSPAVASTARLVGKRYSHLRKVCTNLCELFQTTLEDSGKMWNFFHVFPGCA